jgi:hypothetical protein
VWRAYELTEPYADNVTVSSPASLVRDPPVDTPPASVADTSTAAAAGMPLIVISSGGGVLVGDVFGSAPPDRAVPGGAHPGGERRPRGTFAGPRTEPIRACARWTY